MTGKRLKFEPVPEPKPLTVEYPTVNNLEFFKQLAREKPEVHLGYRVRYESGTQIASFRNPSDAFEFAASRLQITPLIAGSGQSGAAAIVVENEREALRRWEENHATHDQASRVHSKPIYTKKVDV